MKRTTSPSSSAPFKKQNKSRGSWDEERKLALMEAYHNFHPFSVPHGQTTMAWNKVLDAINKTSANILAPLPMNGIKQKKNALFDKFKSVFDKHCHESLSGISASIPTKLGLAVFTAMKDEEDHKENKLLAKLLEKKVKRENENIGDNLMSIAEHGSQSDKNASCPVEEAKAPEKKAGETRNETLPDKILQIMKLESESLEKDDEAKDSIAADCRRIADNSERIAISLEELSLTHKQILEILKK
ncbi:hypothetical protein CLU79DRAFT_754555 [Phycomyces nitens]|nr:hypothetical protein CLU79DRAFT_754555 [Phycomyces nitens]